MTNVNDMRYVRTEEAIRTAFVELVSNQPANSITATAICRRAGISRNAFYLHHSGVSNLYATMINELLAGIREECFGSARRVVASGDVDDELAPALFRAICNSERLLRALLPTDDGALASCLADGIAAAYIDAALLFGTHGGSPDHRLACTYSAWAHVGLIRYWIAETDRPLSDLQPVFEKLHANTMKDATVFLMQGGATRS